MLEGLREKALKHKNLATFDNACLSSSSSNGLYANILLLAFKSIFYASGVCRSKSDFKKELWQTTGKSSRHAVCRTVLSTHSGQYCGGWSATLQRNSPFLLFLPGSARSS